MDWVPLPFLYGCDCSHSDEWKMKSFCLANCEITDPHTADNIAPKTISCYGGRIALETVVRNLTKDLLN